MAEDTTLKDGKDNPDDQYAGQGPGQALLGKMLSHHQKMLDGVAADIGMAERPEHRKGIATCCKAMHGAMCKMIGTHGKEYGLKLKEDGLPDEIGQELEPDEETPTDNSNEDVPGDVEDKEDLPEDEAGLEEDMTEEKAMQAQAHLEQMELQVKQQREMLNSRGFDVPRFVA